MKNKTSLSILRTSLQPSRASNPVCGETVIAPTDVPEVKMNSPPTLTPGQQLSTVLKNLLFQTERLLGLEKIVTSGSLTSTCHSPSRKGKSPVLRYTFTLPHCSHVSAGRISMQAVLQLPCLPPHANLTAFPVCLIFIGCTYLWP